MKKRILCNLLVLVLLLGMLPATALAGGGYQVVWSDDFDSSMYLFDWTIVDANNDGYGFDTSYEMIDDGMSGTKKNNFVCSGKIIDATDGERKASDDFLISPVIDLSEPYYEYELTFEARMLQAVGAPPYTLGYFYVIDANYDLSAKSLKSMPYLHYTSIVPYPSDGWVFQRFDLTAYAGQKIRLAFEHVDDTANQFLLDSFKITEFEPDSHIERICVTGVPEPEVGLSVADMRETGIQVADTANLALVPGSLEYYHTFHESTVPFNGDFEDGGEYDVVFQLQVKEGAFTYADAIASVNGRKAFVTLDDKGTSDSSDDIIEIDYYYGHLHAPKKPLEKLPLSLTPPVAGRTPAVNVQPGIDAFSKTALYWCEVYEDYSEGPMMSATDLYEAGKRYRCYFELKPDAGFCFTEKTQAIVNGEIVPRHYGGLSDGGAWFIAEYVAAADDACTVRFCTEYGKAPAPVTGSIGTWIDLPDLPDQPDAQFGGWAYREDAGASERLMSSYLLAGSRTLYAIWLDPITAPEVGICTYGPDSDAFHTTVVIDPYADFKVVEQVQYESVLWWTDKADVGKPGLRFRGQFNVEQTYYGQLILEADEGHYFAADAGETMVFSGATLDDASVGHRQMRIDFHLDVPGDKILQSAEICVPTRIPGYPVDASTNIGVYSLTPGVNAEPFTGLWAEKEDVGDYTNVYAGPQKPGETYYGEFILRPTGAVTIKKDIQLTIDGASEVSRYTREDAPGLVYVIFAVKIMDTYGFTAIRRSTDGTYPCGYFRADFEPGWSTIFDFAFVPGGEHWIKAMAEPGYSFVEWRKNDGSEQVISKDNPYYFTLDNNDWNIQAVFAPNHTVTFLNAHGDAPAPQTVPDGGLAAEPKGLTAIDFLFRGWFTDPACEDKYDFSTPVTGDLILYSGWEYSPGMSTDKTLLNQCIAEAEALDTSSYTDESVAALQQAIIAAKEVQADPTVSQDTVDAVLDDLNNAVFGLVLKSGAVDKSALEQAIADAEALDTSCYTVESVTALAMTLTGARMVQAASDATQADVDAAVENIKAAVAALEVQPGAVDKNALNKAIAEAEALDTSIYTEETATALGMVLTGAKMVQAASDATQADVDAAVENIKTAIADLELRPGAVDRTWLGLLIDDAETELAHKEQYTEASVTNLQNALESAKSVYDGALTQEAIDAAAAKLDQALNALQYNTPFRFDDVKDESKFYFAPVYWAYDATPQITNGIDATHFGPDRGCTRGQVVTFLWRAAGCPEPAGTETGFTDVVPGAFYEKAVAWAVEKKITNGMSPTSFAPDATCTRGQIVTFLWRFQGESAPGGAENPFTDVKDGAFYYSAVLWAVEHSVTNGMTPTTFGPDLTCTRGQIVTFLNRAVNP